MSALELVAALLGVINVALVVRRSIWNYPFGLAMVSLYFAIFWEAKLYSDALLQIFFFVIQIYGWWAWKSAPQQDHGVAVRWMSIRSRVYWAAGTALCVILWGSGMARWTDAAAPLADAAIAGMSIAAQLLQSFRRVEAWVVWIVVDIVAIILFHSRGLTVTAALYGIFLIMAAVGLNEWRKKVAA